MAFRVEQTARAKRDLQAILEWLVAQEAGDAGRRWFDQLIRAIRSLAEFPRRCPLAPEDAELPFELRQLVFGHKPHFYRVLFTIRDQRVVILHVRHGRRGRASELTD
jgi:plasmid stabilization system protein ParE